MELRRLRNTGHPNENAFGQQKKQVTNRKCTITEDKTETAIPK